MRRARVAAWVVPLLLAAGLADARPALAVTFAVTTATDEGQSAPVGPSCTNTPSGRCTLRAAIQAANVFGGGPHLIVLGGDETYTLTVAGRGEDAAATGDLDVTAHVRIVAGAGGSTIRAGASAATGIDRIFDVRDGGTLELVGVALRHGNPGAADGGAIRALGSLALTNARVADNTAGANGGGVYASGPSLRVRTSTIASNVAGVFGGGLAVEGAGSGARPRLISASTVSANVAGIGGGVFVRSGALDVENVTVSGNSAPSGESLSGSGGGLAAVNATVRLASVTVTANTASVSGGGLLNSSSTLSLKNSIVAQNSAGAVPDCSALGGSGATTLQGYVLMGETSAGNPIRCVLTGDLTGLLTGSAGLGPLQDNGGFTPTHALLAGSQAIDAGNPAGCSDTATPSPAALATDQRGVGRSGNGRCDLGAFEVNAGGPVAVPIDDQVLLEDQTAVVRLLVADADTPAAQAALTVAATSSDSTLVPPENVVFGTAAGVRSATISPAPNASGSALVALRIRDADLRQIDLSFMVTVIAIDDPTTVRWSGTPRYVAGAPPVVLDPGAAVSDIDTSTYAGSQLTVTVASGARPEDRLAIRTGVGPDSVVVQGTSVVVGGMPVGTVGGGAGASPLIVLLNGNATPVQVQAVLRNVTFSTSAPASASESRTVEARVAGPGGASNTARLDLSVVPLGAPGTCQGAPGAARPSVRVRPAAGGGRLVATVEAAPIDATTNNPIASLRFTEVRNARVTLNGQPVVAGQVVATPGAVSVTLGVERVAAGQAAHVAFVVTDACGEWPTFVGGGTAAGF